MMRTRNLSGTRQDKFKAVMREFFKTKERSLHLLFILYFYPVSIKLSDIFTQPNENSRRDPMVLHRSCASDRLVIKLQVPRQMLKPGEKASKP